MMDVLDKYNVRASVLLNADVCRQYPVIVEEGNQRKWVWLAHGKNNSIFQAGMELEEERRYLTDIVNTIKQSTGQQPRGWLGPALTETFNTPRLLAELGLSYLLDWCNDDQPYPLNVEGQRMIMVPYSIELNDITLFVSKSLNGEDFYRTVVDQFDQLYEDGAKTGRVMALCLHPFVINQPFRQRYLDRALEYITKHEGVWVTTSDEIADYYFANYYEQMVGQLRAGRPS
jgi:allantoinase